MASSGPNSNRPLKPALASNRTPRAPLTPRLAGNGSVSTTSTASRRPTTIRPESATVRTPPALKQEDAASIQSVLSSGNVTPRSSARKSRVDSSTHSTPSVGDDTPSRPRPRSIIGAPTERIINGGPTSSSFGYQSTAQKTRPKSLIGEGGKRAPSPLVRSQGFVDLGRPPVDDGIESRFFHASEARKSDVLPKPKLEVKKEPTFFYANGEKEPSPSISPNAASPVLSAVSEKRSSGPWLRTDGSSNPSRSPPMLSPALSSLSAASPFFTSPAIPSRVRTPSPSKENIHLSYRKGASQIFGLRPDRSPAPASTPQQRRSSLVSTAANKTHAKSPSLSSIDSGNSQQSRRRSATTADVLLTPSPLAQQAKAATIPRHARQDTLPSINTSIRQTDLISPPQSALSPTKSINELAADARRERKVLDLEISNSSLLAINSSLEREVRRQKSELKRFRRLSRAGRFSFAPTDRSVRLSEGLSTLGEDHDEDEEAMDMFGRPSGLSEFLDGDDSDDESVTSSAAEPLSPTARTAREKARLEKDEKGLQVDLERHKELLVQSQMMNQSLKRCLYSTDQMLSDGRKALAYQVRVSDIKLGGHILPPEAADGEECQESIHAEDEILNPDDADLEGTKGFRDAWTGRSGISHRRSFESERTDRDSGIEVDKIAQLPVLERPRIEDGGVGRPPDDLLLALSDEVQAALAVPERPKLHWLHSIS